ncbi:hypothetical protein [Clostridium sporogenes]|uniref:Uncharacterized protein n=1 Tax=Clostridium sporogenes TaxID=1509 RepID=A0ABX4K125_CLOSG|nr:hypothetical protein [Clostridium sporogenes]NFH33592.1 hypothetical protein [Clostridium sporogenes]NFL21664.1 hypothetical protein [Clostridium sporogenes]NFL80300.1 hypothetical protein [Clostridium sporogenes]NFN75106.1 hypothetical protein [Clostridium sporogenes]NFU40452.1 hypothetical protein [Clostridium sporogenes]
MSKNKEKDFIDFVNKYMFASENKPIHSFTNKEKEIIKIIMEIFHENDVTVIRATEILEFCKDIAQFSKI